jgi:hypothetical protein
MKMNTKRICLLVMMFTIAFAVARGQSIAVKSNLLYDATTTINLGLEVGVAPKWTIELPINYNPWQFPLTRADGEQVERKIKHWMIQPEGRYWLCERFNGHFFGLHAIAAGYNVGGFKFLGMEDDRYEGNAFGGGVSYGYHWILNSHLSIEATLGVGYVFFDYKQYDCPVCGGKKGDYTKDYIGPTKAGISLIYIIK